jgi:glycosyltransferase involved in cell wall biosynthesis
MKPRPDLIYGRDPRLLFLLADSGVPIILELHDPPRRLDLLIVKLLLRKKNLHRLIVISGGLLGHLKRLYPSIAMSRVTVLPNGARKTEPAFRNSTPPELYGGRERFHIGYAGHLYPGKGMETISALAEVLTDLEFHVVGGMPEDIEYWTNRSRNNIHLYGHINHGDIHAYLTRFDIVVAPFQERVSVHRGKMDISSYTSPLKLFEYMATGKPIIAADLPVLREILQHEVNCLLVPPGDLGAWVRAVEKLRYDKALRETLGRRARSDFEQLFTLDERVRRALDGIPGCSRS